MRKHLILAAAPLALVAVPAHAQNATGTVDVTGSVAGRCLFTTATDLIPLGELALPGSDSNAGKLDAAVVNAGSAELVGWCNHAAATMDVEATALTNLAPVADGFTNVIDYTAVATATNEATASDTTTVAGAGTASNLGMYTGPIAVTIDDAASANKLLVAGAYTGLIKVTLKPNYTPPSP